MAVKITIEADTLEEAREAARRYADNPDSGGKVTPTHQFKYPPRRACAGNDGCQCYDCLVEFQRFH